MHYNACYSVIIHGSSTLKALYNKDFAMKDIDYYNKNAITEATRFDSVHSEQVHRSWQNYWPKENQDMLDIGAGSGRDAEFFHRKGVKVVAVEPAVELLKIASAKTNAVVWRKDKLPELSTIHTTADVILVSAVWMFLSKEERIASFNRLSKLLKDTGKLIITYKSKEIAYQDMIYDATDSGLHCISCSGSVSHIDHITQFSTMVYQHSKIATTPFDSLFD